MSNAVLNEFACKRFDVRTACGTMEVYITTRENQVYEVRISMGKAGGCASSQIDGLSGLLDLCFSAGVENMLDEVIKQIGGIKCYPSNDVATSCADAASQALQAFKCSQNLLKVQEVILTVESAQSSACHLNTEAIEKIKVEIKDKVLPFVD